MVGLAVKKPWPTRQLRYAMTPFVVTFRAGMNIVPFVVTLEKAYHIAMKTSQHTQRNHGERKLSETTAMPEERLKRLTIDIPEVLHRALKLEAVGQGTTMANLVRALLAERIGRESTPQV